ncbi:glycosyltransferase family 2 protein [Chroococcidiopsis sp [FACHB-1243]]|uniref:glycosyltransferase family 2 protein n=1 Tax=Chroococcidiopsis sp. [FACHB-1243] TaxID=2692781 RepID=UPI00322062CE
MKSIKSLPTPVSPFLSHSVTIVIPCLNEEGSLKKLFQTLDRAFQNLGFTLPVLLIDDGSTDSTPQILTQLCCQYVYLKTIRHPQKRGVTGVWKTAIAHVNTEWVFWGQADLESDFQTDLPLLLEACVPGVDGVAGWRQQRGDGKVMASKFANLACRMFFGLKIHDMNWIKLVRRDILAEIPFNIVTHRYLLAVLAGWGYNITEVFTPWHPRFSGKSKFGRGRLMTSAMSFLRALCWFHVERQLHQPRLYISAAFKAIYVGFRAGREAFELQVQSDRLANY